MLDIADHVHIWNCCTEKVFVGQPFRPKADREALGQYVVRGATSAEKISYYEACDTVVWTASTKGYFKGKTENFKGFEFVDQQTAGLRPGRRN